MLNRKQFLIARKFMTFSGKTFYYLLFEKNTGHNRQSNYNILENRSDNYIYFISKEKITKFISVCLSFFLYKPAAVNKPKVCVRLCTNSVFVMPNNCLNVKRNCGDATPYNIKFNAWFEYDNNNVIELNSR